MLIPHYIGHLLRRGLQEAQARHLLPPLVEPEIAVERPQNPEHGDYASSVALKLARAARMSPMAIAEALVQVLPHDDLISQAVAVAPGFINITLAPRWLVQQVEVILREAAAYGNLALGRGERVQVEFVSANPTGPLHVGNGRGAVLGSTLAHLLRAVGYEVQTEYYINDAGSQVEAFRRTLYARYCQELGRAADLPEDGYAGMYMVELAKEVVKEHGEKFLQMPQEEALGALGELGLERMIGVIGDDLRALGVSFDRWYSERSLFAEGQYQRALALLRQKAYLEEKDGALWFVSTALGDSKDNVVVRSNGAPTYFASDIAYHYNKFAERGFARVINIWGADHQGHVSRMKAVVEALGFDPERLQVIILQMVSLRRGPEIVRISKRTGDIITLREVLEEVGPDACRFFFLARSADSQMDFDLELAKKEAPENPVYYVQYAHARIASILRLAQERGISYGDGDPFLLVSEPELALLRKLVQLPEVMETAVKHLEPHHLPYFAQELATLFHAFYRDCRVVSDDLPLTKARLKLVQATQTVLAKTLHLMGMTAPERM